MPGYDAARRRNRRRPQRSPGHASFKGRRPVGPVVRTLVVLAEPLPVRPVMMSRPFGGGLLRPEIGPAARAQFGLLSDHAGGHPLHVGNFRTAQAERIAHASLLLFSGISPSCRRQDPRGCQDHSTEQFSSKCKVTHDSPESTPGEIVSKQPRVGKRTFTPRCK